MIKITRRQFLGTLGAAIVGLLAPRCNPNPAPTSQHIESTPPIATPSTTPSTLNTGTPHPTGSPAQTATLEIIPSPTNSPARSVTQPIASTPKVVTPKATTSTQVAIAKAASYDRKLVRQQVQTLLDELGGAKNIFNSSSRVALKINLTGGTAFKPPAGVTAVESHVTHPEIVRALGELARDAGVKTLYIVEAVDDPKCISAWGYSEIIQSLNATLIDLNSPAPYKDFISVPVGNGAFIYQDFTVNPILKEIDVFVSIAKLKCHYNAGVTLSMKNLIGLVPATAYRLRPDHVWRSAMHGENDTPTRLPRIVVDINRARPIHLALIDGIKSGEGGEVPRGSFAPVKPGVLIAGKNAVATDAVATAVMGFDPTAEYPNAPFLNGHNHLNLAYGLRLGTNRLNEIQVVGNSIEAVRYPFQPATRME